MGHEVWTQGDKYSYGILLLAMFTGKRPMDNMFQGTLDLHNFVKASLPEQNIDTVDPALVQEKVYVCVGGGGWCGDGVRVPIKIEESLISIFKIGVACSAELPRERLDISDGMSKMYQIRNKLASS